MTTDSGNVKICRATHTNKFCIYFCFLLQCLTRSVPEETPPVPAPPGHPPPRDRGRGAWQIKTIWVPGQLPASRNPLNHHAALQAYSLNNTGVPDICKVPSIIFATSYFKFVGNCVKEFAPSSIQSSRLSQPLGPWRLRGFLRGAQTLPTVTDKDVPSLLSVLGGHQPPMCEDCAIDSSVQWKKWPVSYTD